MSATQTAGTSRAFWWAMTIARIGSLFLTLLVLSACAKDSVELATSYRLTEVDCEGTKAVLGDGYKETVVIHGASLLYTWATADCSKTSVAVAVIKDSTLHYQVSSTTSKPDPCAVVASFNGTDMELPGIPSTGQIELDGDGKTITATTDVLGTECTSTYIAY